MLYCVAALILFLVSWWFNLPKLVLQWFFPVKVQIKGSVAPGYEPVKKEFEDNFKKGLEAEAQLCVYVEGKKVVDLWASVDNDPSYTDDSLGIIFSNSKQISAIIFAKLVDKGLLNYSDKISKHWPEFAQNDKSEVTVENVMQHEAGLSFVRMSLNEKSVITAGIKRNEIGKYIEIAKQQFPDPEYKTKRQYHTMTQGYIQNEIFRRLDPEGRTMGEVLRREIAGPLGADVHIGLNDDEVGRVVEYKAWNRFSVMFQMAWPSLLGSKIERSIMGYFKGIHKAYRLSQMRTMMVFFPWRKYADTFRLSDYSPWHNPHTMK